MITAEQKSLDQMKASIEDAEKVLVLGCGTCVTVCFAGGDKESAIVASSLRMATKLDNKEKDISHATVQRQCEWEYLDQVTEQVNEADMVLSMGCGIGVQAIAEHFPDSWVVPGLNTNFLGIPTEHGVWEERCAACGECVLEITGGICPIARCSKSLMNGPCGGSEDGHCEIDKDVDCAWQLIYDRLAKNNKLESIYKLQPPKDWSKSRDGGPRKIVRQDLRFVDRELEE